MKRIKKVCMFLAFLLTFADLQPPAAFAKTPDEEYIINTVHTYGETASISISKSGDANIKASLKTGFGASTELTVCLQCKNTSTGKWITVNTWKKSFKSATVIFDTMYNLRQKGTYRVKVTATVEKNVKTETVHTMSDSKKY